MVGSIGALVVDVTIAPEGQLRLDDDRNASIKIGGGGQAANFCAWSAALGEDSRLITRVGADDVGSRLISEIEAGGVEVRAVRGQEPTGAIAVLVGPNGERTFATQQGASLGLRPEEVEDEWFADLALLHVPAYSLFTEPLASTTRKAIAAARLGGALLSVDLSSVAGVRQFGGARLAYDLAMLQPELLFASESEAAELGAPLEGLAKVPVVKLGVRGCRIFNRRVPASRVDSVDATGAGDAFAAAFCSSYLDGAAPLEAAGRAVLVGAFAVSRMGARP
ncbi:MAG: carbohydrate kinase family protein [Candidatus Dormibacteraceae bacterium]